MKIHSYGCSFVAGNGVDTKVERTLIGTPKLRKYREGLSFTGQLAKLLDCEFNNFGKSGSNPNFLLDLVVNSIEENKIAKGDLVICCFTSPLKNTPGFFPTYFESKSKIGLKGISVGLNELAFHKRNEFHQLGGESDTLTKTNLLKYRKEFFTKFFDYNIHFDYYSQNIVFLLQYLFDLYKINHIFIDAFDTFITNDVYDKTEHIEKSKYCGYGEFNIWSYLNQFNDKQLFEYENLSETLYEGKLHPSAKGHKLIAEELFKVYKSNYE